MATWISHLRIAEDLLDVLPGLDEAAFAFGSLAPDSGVPNADWTAFDPPKEVTHFLESREGVYTQDLQFYREYMQGLTLNGNAARYSFVLGYFFHLVCDSLWWIFICQSSKKAYAALFAERGNAAAWETLKDDWYGLDHLYVRDHSNSLFWRVVMRAPNPPMYVSIVPGPALHQQLDFIRTYYTQPEPGRVLDRPFPYLNEATWSRYVSDSIAAVLKIHAWLQSRHAPPDTQTALSLLDEQDIQPYIPPLGDVPPAQG